MTNKGKILGIDYGAKQIGIAITDENQNIVFGRGVIENKSDEHSIAEIKNLCENESVVQIIVGLPILLSGDKTKQTIKTEQFVDKLKKIVDIPIEFEDEALTSHKSDAILSSIKIDLKNSKKRQKRYKDQRNITSAVLILETFLNKNS